ncbi:exocyst complex component EXO70A1 [Quercus suber]|uniref:Exocyst subunit Exo70 family protein n=1 Tax=Quercus suber TaxID=58331 RepID=A0AAW0J1A6_QUESU
MGKWIQFVKIVVRLILNSKKSESKEIRFNETMKGCVMQLLSFGKAVAIGRKSPQKLFGILDMYDAMAEALAQLEGLITDNVVINKVKDVLTRLSEAARGTFPKLENAVYNGTSVKFMQSGEIDPLSRYVMGYVQSLLDYSDTLNLLLGNIDEDDDRLEALTPLGRQLLVLITCLQFNLQKKSKLYGDDDALQYIFLMNNTLYIVQKVKYLDLGGFLGDNWVHKHHEQVRQYATSYYKASWTEVLLCLKDEGVGQSFSNASNRFKNFNASFEEVYRVQTAWKVPDAQLRQDLRISIMENVITAYRSFMGMLGNQVESGRYAGKYIKYTADDLESYLLDLFEGSPRILLKKYIG